MSYLFTSESVTEGHPDKLADQISDAILDDILSKDRHARVAVETFVTNGLALIGGEVTTSCYCPIAKIVRNTVKRAGYDCDEYGFDYRSIAVLTNINEQSPDIALGTTDKLKKKQGAGDQGLMFGYACRETKELMPLAISLAHGLTRQLAAVRKKGGLKYLRPDGKAQVTVEYDDNHQPQRVDTIVLSTQHDPDVTQAKLKAGVLAKVIKPIIGKWMDAKTKVLINPTGRFVLGGPPVDTGLTGRKIIVDTYGGYARHGGGAFSGKDPSKVDRSAAYAARWVAKHIVAAGAAERAEVQVAYAIGHHQPVSIHIETFGTETIEKEKIVRAVQQTFDLSPAGIIKDLDLVRPIYSQTATYGHFGKTGTGMTWEKTSRLAALKKALK